MDTIEQQQRCEVVATDSDLPFQGRGDERELASELRRAELVARRPLGGLGLVGHQLEGGMTFGLGGRPAGRRFGVGEGRAIDPELRIALPQLHSAGLERRAVRHNVVDHERCAARITPLRRVSAFSHKLSARALARCR